MIDVAGCDDAKVFGHVISFRPEFVQIFCRGLRSDQCKIADERRATAADQAAKDADVARRRASFENALSNMKNIAESQ